MVQKFMVEKSRVGKFMVQKSGVEKFLVKKSGVGKFMLKNLGLKGPGLKVGVEKSRVEMSFNHCKDHIKKKHEISNYDITNHINEIESFTLISNKLIEGENKNQENIEISELINEDDIAVSQENVVTVITEEPISDNNVTEMTLIANQVSIDTGGFQLQFVSISWVINHMTC
jgi:hypothetical protein